LQNFSIWETCKESVFIIAEIGNNHDGDVERAIELVDIAAEAGVDAVKFQSFRGLDIVSPHVTAKEYDGWAVEEYEYWHEFLDSIALPLEAHREVFNHAINRGLVPFSTPTSPAIVDFLEELDVSLYKLASMDLTNVPLIRRLAATGKPILFSTGMAEIQEVEWALNACRDNETVMLHCISDYPTLPENANLRAIEFLQETFGGPVGLSDHAVTNEFALGAVAMGARVVEKHITYSRASQHKAEHHFALEPAELSSLVQSIRALEAGLGEKSMKRSPSELVNRKKFRRGLHLNTRLKKGERLEPQHISVVRPNTGDNPGNFEFYLNKRLKLDTDAWTPLTRELVEP
jgi:sialic acid synthase SpsE